MCLNNTFFSAPNDPLILQECGTNIMPYPFLHCNLHTDGEVDYLCNKLQELKV